MPFLREKSGRWSPEKIIAFTAACLPALWLAWRAWDGDLNPARPVNEAIHDAGSWTVRFLLLSLAVSPARRLFAAPKLINMRRTLGVTAFCYAALHLTLYFVQEKFDLWKIGSEIALRIYLTIGFVALIGLIALAVTSTNGMIKRLGGPRWNRLPHSRLSDRHPRRDPLHDADQSRHHRVGDGRGLSVLAARLSTFIHPLCRRGHPCLVGGTGVHRLRADRHCRSDVVRRNDRRLGRPRVRGQFRLGHGIPPGALGADRRTWRHAGVILLVVRGSASEGAQGLGNRRPARRGPGPVRGADAAPR